MVMTEKLALETKIREQIFVGAQTANEREPARVYLGMSQIGHPCLRKLWFDYRQATKEPLKGQTCRIFKAGHSLETRVIQSLEDADFKVIGRQGSCAMFDYRFLGHIDGVVNIYGENLLLEIKGVNNNSFEKFADKREHSIDKKNPSPKGIYTKPQYAAQVQVYMGCSQKEGGITDIDPLNKTLFVVENKNNQDLFIQIVDFRPDLFERIVARAKTVIEANTPPEGIKDTTSEKLRKHIWESCNWCDYQSICDREDKWPPLIKTRCLDCKHFRSVSSNSLRLLKLREKLKNYTSTLDSIYNHICNELPAYAKYLEYYLKQELRWPKIVELFDDYYIVIDSHWCAHHKRELKKICGCKQWEGFNSNDV
jgi:hypothetical protein